MELHIYYLVSDCVRNANLYYKKQIVQFHHRALSTFLVMNSVETSFSERKTPNQQASLFHIQFISVTIRHYSHPGSFMSIKSIIKFLRSNILALL